ncbi:MAG TPA: EamA family transporter [Baekduia sp.]|nr:EamA family transporter [Baekduia sp.]
MDVGSTTLIAIVPMLAWGLGDYVAGTAGRAVAALDSVNWSQFVSGVLVVAGVLAGGGAFRLADDLPAALGGAAGVLGLICFYHAMRVAPVVVVAPLVASGVGLPVLYGVIVDGGISRAAIAGITVGLFGIVCVTMTAPDNAEPDGRAVDARALLLAAGGAIGYGAFLIGVAVSSSRHPFDATLVARAGALAVAVPMLIARAVAKRRTGAALPPLTFIGVLGLLDALGVLAFALAVHHANVAVVSVLASLYPAVTVGLAFCFDEQTLSRREKIGIALTLAALPFLAAGTG